MIEPAVFSGVFAILATYLFQMWRVHRKYIAALDRIGPITMNDLNEAVAFKRERTVSIENLQREINSMGYAFQFINGFRMDWEETDKRATWHRAKARLNGEKMTFQYLLADLNEKNFGKIQKKFRSYGDRCFVIHAQDKNISKIIYLAILNLCGGAMYGRGNFIGTREAIGGLRYFLNLPNFDTLNSSDNS